MSRRMFHRVLTKGDELSPAVMARFVQTIRRDALMPQVVRLLIESLISPRISVPALCCGASNQTSVPRDFGFGSGIRELALASYRKSSPTIPETMGTSRRKCNKKCKTRATIMKIVAKTTATEIGALQKREASVLTVLRY